MLPPIAIAAILSLLATPLLAQRVQFPTPHNRCSTYTLPDNADAHVRGTTAAAPYAVTPGAPRTCRRHTLSINALTHRAVGPPPPFDPYAVGGSSPPRRHRCHITLRRRPPSRTQRRHHRRLQRSPNPAQHRTEPEPVHISARAVRHHAGRRRLLGENATAPAGAELRIHVPLRQAIRPKRLRLQSRRDLDHVCVPDVRQHRHAAARDAGLCGQLAARSGERPADSGPPRGGRSRLAAAAVRCVSRLRLVSRIATNGSAASSASAPACTATSTTSIPIRFASWAGPPPTSRISPNMDVVFGVVYLDRVDIKILPVAGVYYRPTPDWDMYLVFPNPKVRKFLAAVGTTKWYGYAAGEYGGGSWTVARQTTRRSHRLQRHPRDRRPRMGNANTDPRPHRTRLRLRSRNRIRLRRSAELQAGRHDHAAGRRRFLARESRTPGAPGYERVTRFLHTLPVTTNESTDCATDCWCSSSARLPRKRHTRQPRRPTRPGAGTRCRRKCRISQR